MEINWLHFVVPLLTAVVSLAIGCLMLLSADISLVQARKSKNWPVIPGVITQSTIEKREQGEEDQALRVTYEPTIRYQYTIQDQQYIGQRVFFGMAHLDQQGAQYLTSHYLPGMGVLVHYHPRNPTQAVLETDAPSAREIRRLGLAILLVGLTAALIFALMVLFTLG